MFWTNVLKIPCSEQELWKGEIVSSSGTEAGGLAEECNKGDVLGTKDRQVCHS